MDSERLVRDLEEQFWTGGVDLYRERLSDDALLVFAAPIGVLSKADAVQSIAQSPRWAEVRLSGTRFVHLNSEALIMTYSASARRAGDESPYRAQASSAYVHRDGRWMLAFHQQTGAADAPRSTGGHS